MKSLRGSTRETVKRFENCSPILVKSIETMPRRIYRAGISHDS